MSTLETSMRVPCNRCGQLNSVERAAEVTFRCAACGSENTVRAFTGAGSAPAGEPRVAPRRWQPELGRRSAGRPVAAAPREGRSFFSRARQGLVILLVLATASTLVHSGTFATFNATTANAANITSGVLLLGNKVANGSSSAECFSAGGAAPGNPQTINSTNSSSCTGVWNVAAPNKPGDTFIAHLALRNPGNVSATTLQLYASVATCDSAPGYTDATSGVTFKGANQSVSTTLNGATIVGATSFTVASAAGLVIGDVIQVDTGANYEQLTISNIAGNVLTTNAAAKAHANGVAVNGGGLCRQAELAVAKTDATYEAAAAGTCLYGNSAAAGAPMTGALKCAYQTTSNLRDFNDNYALGGSNPGPISIAGGIAAGATQYYIVAITFPAGSDNGYQGLGAAVTFNWFAQQ